MNFIAPELLAAFRVLPRDFVIIDCETTGLFDEKGAPGCVSVGICQVIDGFMEGEGLTVLWRRKQLK